MFQDNPLTRSDWINNLCHH